MTTVYQFTVPGHPVTWKRAQRGNGHSYTDPKDAAHRERIRALARNAGIRSPMLGPVRLICRFFLPVDPLAPTAGDLDNYEKAVKDALQGIAFVNDRQVCSAMKSKAKAHGTPCTEVWIEALASHALVNEMEAPDEGR